MPRIFLVVEAPPGSVLAAATAGAISALISAYKAAHRRCS